MTGKLPDPLNTENYQRIPFQFIDELSSKNVFLQLPDAFSPLERMIIQANGNLQRILSAYYNAPSQVEIISNEVVNSLEINNILFKRKITMHFDEKYAYTADSILLVKDKTILELIEKHKYGLGQIFGHTHTTPDFVLHAVGRHGNAPGASFWRDYSLTIPNVLDCFIRETFVEGLFEEFKGDSCDGTIWLNTSPPSSPTRPSFP